MVVSSVYAGLTVSFRIDSSMGLAQWYYSNNGKFEPSWTETPLILTPKTSVSDPDGLIKSLSYETYWYEVTDGVETLITSTDASAGVYLDGERLVVKKNLGEGGSATYRCRLVCADTRNATTFKLEKDVTLGCSVNADAQYYVKILAPKRYHYNPLAGAGLSGGSTYALKGQVLLATDDISSREGLTYDWQYWTGKAWASIATDGTMPEYVSGQGAQTLMLDLEKTEGINLRLRVELDGEPLKEEAYCAASWQYPRLNGTVYSPQGQTVGAGVDHMDFYAKLRYDNHDLSEDVAEEYLRLEWQWKKTNSAAVISAGWGLEKRLDADKLRCTGTTNAVVYPLVSTLGALLLLEDADGNYVVDEDGNYVLGRAM